MSDSYMPHVTNRTIELNDYSTKEKKRFGSLSQESLDLSPQGKQRIYSRNTNRGSRKPTQRSDIRICSSLHKPDYSQDYSLKKVSTIRGVSESVSQFGTPRDRET